MQYWPPALDKQEVYGDIHIGIVNEEQLANFQIRTFRVWKLTPNVRKSMTIGKCPLCYFSLSFSPPPEYYSRRTSYSSISLH